MSGMRTPAVNISKAKFSVLTSNHTNIADKAVDRKTVNQDPVTNATGKWLIVM